MDIITLSPVDAALATRMERFPATMDDGFTPLTAGTAHLRHMYPSKAPEIVTTYTDLVAAAVSCYGDMWERVRDSWEREYVDLGAVAPTVGFSATALDWAQRLCYRYVGTGYGNLTFDEGGKARFGQIVGWLTGLAMAGKAKEAGALALDFRQTLDRLNGYTRQEEYPVYQSGSNPDAEIGRIKVGRYKVVLGDDGTFGGFRLAWYRAIPSCTVVRETQVANPTIGKDADEPHHVWTDALDAMKARMGIRKDLEGYAYFRPNWLKEGETGSICEIVHYGYDFNGGLLYHGPGAGETFAVTLGDVRAWSVHT